MSNARHCVTCGKKYYPKAWNSYPEDDYNYCNTPDYNQRINYTVLPEHKRFHSLGCMKEWIAINSIAFANLIDSLSHNMIQDNNNNNRERNTNG